MSKDSLSIVALIVALTVLVLMLIGGRLLRGWRKMRSDAATQAERVARQHRDETGRQRQQYSRHQQPDVASTQRMKSDADSSRYQEHSEPRQQEDPSQPHAHRMQAESGETVIDHHHDRRGNKIFEDSEGEYVEFTES